MPCSPVRPSPHPPPTLPPPFPFSTPPRPAPPENGNRIGGALRAPANACGPGARRGGLGLSRPGPTMGTASARPGPEARELLPLLSHAVRSRAGGGGAARAGRGGGLGHPAP
jgi:hypothetical protein